MPSGKTHDSITLWCWPAIAGLGWGITHHAGLALVASGCFLFSGLMFGPDLDIHSQQYRRWGWLRWIWLPYRQSLHHRSILSHGFLVGTTLRLLYLALLIGTVVGSGILGWSIARHSLGQGDWLAFAMPLWQRSWQPIGQAWQQYPEYWLASFVGLEAGAMSHSLSDWVGSKLKRWRNRRLKKTKPS